MWPAISWNALWPKPCHLNEMQAQRMPAWLILFEDAEGGGWGSSLIQAICPTQMPPLLSFWSEQRPPSPPLGSSRLLILGGIFFATGSGRLRSFALQCWGRSPNESRSSLHLQGCLWELIISCKIFCFPFFEAKIAAFSSFSQIVLYKMANNNNWFFCRD